MSPKKSKRSCKKCGILIRDHHHAKAGRFCTGPPWPAPTPSPDPPAAADSPQIPDLETLQQQREDLQSAIQRARLAREVRDLEADLRALQLDITSGKPVNSPPATPEKQLPGATPPVPPPANQTPPPSEQTPADHTPPPPPPPAQTTTTQTPPPPALTPPIVPPPAPAPAGTPPPANLQELRQHPQIQAAMQELTSSSLALDDLLSRPTTVPATSTVPASTPSPAAPLRRIDQDPQIYLATNTGETALQILDFLSPSSIVKHEQVATTAEGTKLWVSMGGKKPALRSVTVSQWAIANTKIMYKLLSTNKLSTTSMHDYMAYTIKILELGQRYTWPSVLEFDREYRTLQANYHFRWGADSQHLVTKHLDPLRAAPPTATNLSTKASKPSASPIAASGKPICRKYNFAIAGCPHSPCRYEHVCWIPNCGKSHPQSRHASPGLTSPPPSSN